MSEHATPGGPPPVEALRPRRRLPTRVGLAGHVAGIVLAVGGAALLACAAVDVLAHGDAGPVLAGTGGAAAAAGFGLRAVFVAPARLRLVATFGAAVTAWLVASGLAAVTYLLTGAIDRPDDALFDGVAGFTTTALTTITAVEDLSAGLLLWRAVTQWLGGLGAIVMIVAVLPSIGAGGLQTVESADRAGSGLLGARMQGVMRRLGALYAGFTAVVGVAYLAGGMSPLDAAAHALSTASTGGFSTHRESFAHFESATLEWIAVVAMLVAGTNVALVWRALRRRQRSVLRSVELRAYGALALGGSAVAMVWTAPAGGPTHESVRHAAFSVSSALSTTGLTVADWGEWLVAAQVLLLLLIGVGAMAGSTGGGFTVMRLLALLGYMRRELVRQLHPRAVRVVRIGRAVADEELLGRMVGYQVLYLLAAAAAAIGVAATGEEIVTAASAAISGLSTAGPGLGDLGPGGGAAELGPGARGVLMVVMLLGRLEIYPVVVAAGGVLGMARRLERREAAAVRRAVQR